MTNRVNKMTNRVNVIRNTNKTPISYDYVLMIDFEANCEKDIQLVPQEIIEFPVIMIKIYGENKRPQEIGRFHSYVKPRIHKLTEFCIKLTGITQDKVDSAKDIVEVINDFNSWLQSFGLDQWDPLVPGKKFIFMSCGNWDLMTCFPNCMNYFNISYPKCFRYWLNIKKEYMRFYVKPKPYDLHALLREFDLQPYGVHHSGMDDTINIARVLILMISDGYRPKIYL